MPETTTVTVPAVSVGVVYLSDDTEDVLTGAELRDGMVVLIADPMFRPRSDSKVDCEVARALEGGRWCRVSKLQFRGDLVSFVGVYHDGSKIPRTYHVVYHWFVKMNSMRDEVSA